MKWVELKYFLFPLFIQQIEKVEKYYMSLIKEISIKKDKGKEAMLDELKNDIVNRIEEIDNFIEDNFEKENVLHFEKGRLKLKKLILINPNQSNTHESKMKRKLIEIEDENEEEDKGKEEECPIYNRGNLTMKKKIIKRDKQMNQNDFKTATYEEENKKGKIENKKMQTPNTLINNNQQSNLIINNNSRKDYEMLYQFNDETNARNYTNSHRLGNLLSFQYKSDEDKKGLAVYAINNDNREIKGKQSTMSRSLSNLGEKKQQQSNIMTNDHKKEVNSKERTDKTIQNSQRELPMKPCINQSLPNNKQFPEESIPSLQSKSHNEEINKETELKEISLLFKLNEGEYRLLQKEKAKRVIILLTS